MSKRPIEWHETNYNNAKTHLTEKIDLLQRQTIEALHQYDNNEFYKTQIEEAKRKKMDGFDSERFMIPKKKENKK